MSVIEDWDGQYMTEAIESGVFDVEGETIGHVGLLDLDETSLRIAEEVARREPGTSVVLRSSERSYHVWSLAVRSLDAWIEEAERLAESCDVDVEHTLLSESRGCAVLRTDAKVDVSSGEEITSAPRPLRVVESPSRHPQSEPHARLLREEFGVDVSLDDDESVGHSVERRVYMADVGGRS